MPPFKFTDSPDIVKPSGRPVFTDSPDVAPAAPKRPMFTDSPDLAPPVMAAPKPSPAPSPTFQPPAAPSAGGLASWPPQGRADIDKPLPASVRGERVRQQFITERAASGLRDLTDVFDPKVRQNLVSEAEGTARAERIGQERYPGSPIKAGVSRPMQQGIGSRWAAERMAYETRAPGASEANEQLYRSVPSFLRPYASTAPAPSSWQPAKPSAPDDAARLKLEADARAELGMPDPAQEWARQNMAVPRKTVSGRQMLGTPGWEETAQLALAAPILAPLGVADELYRQTKVSMRDAGWMDPATTPEEREGFLPQGDIPAMNLGRAVARLPSALGEVAMDTGANIGRNIRDEGFVAGLGKSLGMDKDPVRNVWAGEESAAEGEDWGESWWRGIERAPGEAMDLLTLPLTMAYAGAKQVGKLGDPTYEPGEVIKEAADVAKDVGAGALRSFARTWLDPRKEFETAPIGAALNAAAVGSGVRSLASAPLERVAADTALLKKKIAITDRVIQPLAEQSSQVYKAAAAAEDLANSLDEAVRNMEARFEVAERAGTDIPQSAYDELNRVREARAQADLDVAAKRQAVEAFAGPSAKTEELAKGWARVVEKNPGDVKAKSALAEATAKLEAAGVPNRTLQTALQKKLSLESRLTNKQRLGNVIEAAARVPSWVATLGTSAGNDMLNYIARRLGDKFPESRYWLSARNNVVPEEFMAIEREGGALQSKASRAAIEMIRAIPEWARPTVRKFLQSEHSPLEGGYWNPGNDPSRYMFEFRMGKQPMTPRDKYRRSQVIARGKMPESQTSFERTAYGDMMRDAKLEEARVLRARAMDLEEGVGVIDDLDGAALDLKRSEVQAQLDAINAQIDELVGARAERGAAAASKAEDAAIRAQGADFELGAAKAREAELARGIGARAENRPMDVDAIKTEQARISEIASSLRAAREAATKQARAEIKQGLSAQTEAAVGAAFDARKAKLGEMRDVWAEALKLAREEAQAAINATPRGGKTATRETWDKAIGAERRAEELKQARTQGAEDLRTQLSIKAARAAESRAWAAWQDSLVRSERAQAAADAAKVRGEVADLNSVIAAKNAAAKAWDSARRATYRAEVAARSRLEDLARIEESANAAIRRETGLGPSDPMRMGAAVPRPTGGAEGPSIPRSQSAGPVLARDAARSREAVVGMKEEAALLTARLQELDSLAALRAQGQRLPDAAERAAMAKDLRDASIKADDWVAKMDNEQMIVNRYGKGLAGLSRQYTERAKTLKMFENAEQIRDLYWPQLYDESVRKGAMDPLGAVSASEKAKLAPYLKAGSFKANELRRAGVPMTRREAEFGLKTDLAEEAMVGLMSFIDDVEMYDIYRKAAETPGLTRTAEQFEQMKAAAIADHNARVAQQYRGNPTAIAENAIDPVTGRGADQLPVMSEWIPVPDEARFPKQVQERLATGGKADEGLMKYGALGGKYVPADLYFDMVNRRAVMEQMASGLNRVNSMLKSAKTVWSVATHARNLLSNLLVFAPMAGMALWNPMNLPFYARALKDLVSAKKSPMYRLAEQDGVFKGGFGSNELGRNYLNAQLQGAFESVTEPGKRLIEMLADAGSYAAKRGKDVRTGAVAREREMALKLLDVKDQKDWLRLRASSPELASTAAGKSAVESGKAAVSSAMDLPGLVYSASDDLFRYAYYLKNMEKMARGKLTAPELLHVTERTPIALDARANYMDYENVPGFAHVLKAPTASVGRDGKPRDWNRGIYWVAGQPFISFQTRAIPRVRDWAFKDPIRTELALQMSDRLTDMNAALSGVSRDEGEAAKAAYPFASSSSLKPLGHIIPELGKDEQGRINLANIGYLSPPASLTETKANKYDTEPAQVAAFIGKLLGVAPGMLIGPLYEQAMNRTFFSGRPVVREGSTLGEDLAQRLSHLIQSYGSPNLVSPSDVISGQMGVDTQSLSRVRGGTQNEQIAAGIEGVPDAYGRERTGLGALGSVLSGTKVLGVTLDDALEAEAKQVEAQRNEIAATSQAATGIQVSRTNMNKAEKVEFARDYRKRLTPVLATFREALARYPASKVVNRMRRGFRLLDGAPNDVKWMERADDLLDEALSNAAEKAAEAKRIRTDAMRQGATR